jgi:hypothetical protein
VKIGEAWVWGLIFQDEPIDQIVVFTTISCFFAILKQWNSRRLICNVDESPDGSACLHVTPFSDK